MSPINAPTPHFPVLGSHLICFVYLTFKIKLGKEQFILYLLPSLFLLKSRVFTPVSLLKLLWAVALERDPLDMFRPSYQTQWTCSAFIFLDLLDAFSPSLSLVLCLHYGRFICPSAGLSFLLSGRTCLWFQLRALLVTVFPLASSSVLLTASWT